MSNKKSFIKDIKKRQIYLWHNISKIYLAFFRSLIKDFILNIQFHFVTINWGCFYILPLPSFSKTERDKINRSRVMNELKISLCLVFFLHLKIKVDIFMHLFWNCFWQLYFPACRCHCCSWLPTDGGQVMAKPFAQMKGLTASVNATLRS